MRSRRTIERTRIAGDPAGVAAAMLLALSPGLVAHGSLATTDVAFVAAALVALMSLAAYVEVPTRRRLGFLAIGLTLATATKYSSIGLFLVVALTRFVDHARRDGGVHGIARAAWRAALL
jgi:4-amino-4-deoxy-L-arabinose transferase-like glycosyltransferase